MRPRKHYPVEYFRYRGAGWHPSFSRGLHRRVHVLIPDIMDALDLSHPDDYPSESEEVEEDIVVALLKAWATLRDYNRVPTDAGVRQILKKLRHLPPRTDPGSR